MIQELEEEKVRDLKVRSGREGPTALGQGRSKLPAGTDAELGEHLTQVPFDRAGAEEQLGADLPVEVTPVERAP